MDNRILVFCLLNPLKEGGGGGVHRDAQKGVNYGKIQSMGTSRGVRMDRTCPSRVRGDIYYNIDC